ncbi:MAG TPA: MmcQ/YjbR family DNA-binding protein [Myxococcales bacterium]|nr:MmcQ/YjbR family DNA-binding protein [Myxococcales bacterium]
MVRARWVPDEKVVAKVRKLCASLPGVEERTAWGHPVWRAGGRHFAAYEPKQGQDYLFFLVESEMLAALARTGPRFRDGGYSKGDTGWIGLRLDAATDWGGEVKDLLQRSFTLVTGMKPARPRARKR